MTDAPQIPAEQTGPRFETITLSTPIVRGETRIEKIDLRKPRAGELRGGITLQDIITTDATALLKLIPRISNPPLTQAEADALEADDFAEIGGAIRGFFMTSGEKQVIEAMMAEHQPKT